jgi:FtsH-binding integral membrane protein
MERKFTPFENEDIDIAQEEEAVDVNPPLEKQGSFRATNRGLFIFKTYLVLTFQLALTFGFALTVLLIPDLNSFVATNVPAIVAFIFGMFLFLIPLACCGRQMFVTSQILLMFGFTICSGYLVAAICTGYETLSVLLIIGLTLCITFFFKLSCFVSLSSKIRSYGRFTFSDNSVGVLNITFNLFWNLLYIWRWMQNLGYDLELVRSYHFFLLYCR